MIKKDILSPEQEIAAEPTLNVWVQANAGTGKTSVLTARLLRILFRGNEPAGGILCLTYTNAAAGEMRNRILAALRGWAMADDNELRELLVGVSTNNPPTDDDIAHARGIFFKYIDNPDMLKIKTIHGFCEEVLHRFPTEAGISPSWSLISDAPQRVMLNDALNNLINSSTNDARTVGAFNHIVGVMSEYKLDDLLSNIEGQYKNFFVVNNYDNYRNYFIDTIEKKLNIKNTKNIEKNVQNLKNILDFAKDEKKPTKALENLIYLTEQYIENTIDFNEYKFAYLTRTGTPIQKGLNYEYLSVERERVLAANAYQINKQIYMDTIALFDLSGAFAQKYAELKQFHNVLDFEDLILYTHRLFSNPENMGWVLSQMDFSLSHILVDEAQDTGPLQWELLQMLSGDFFAEGDRTNLPRSIFVVGDTKQSIYGFQGADPNAFAASRAQIATQIKNNARQIREVPLTQSFRSVEPILKTVDMFFGDANVAARTGFLNNPHKCFRVGDRGVVEIHGIMTPGDNETSVVRKEYIKQIGDKISQLLATGKYQPHDIMILVQNRNPFAVPMANELKRRGIDVAGSDRVVLPNFPVIRDLMNLLRFCINPDDDYSLACVLKSPMFRLNDAHIYDICTPRNAENARRKKTLGDFTPVRIWDVLESMYPEIYSILNDFIKCAQIYGPYSFFTHVLNNYNMRQKFIVALGNQIIDPLEEFITICLAYERTRPGTLRHFIKWFITGNSEIKRDMDSGSGVRIVTIHGSKGLQSRVVFLIDTVSVPKSRYIYNLPDERMPIWVWTPRTPSGLSPEFARIRDTEFDKDIEESYRLLYVAMTRARDELYIYGFTSNRAAPELSWHNMLWNTLLPKVGATNNTIRISNYDK